MSTLTLRQRAVLGAIRQSMADRGYPPTMTELGKAVGLTSTSSVAHQLRALQALGYIVRVPGSARAIRILDQETPRD